MKSKQNKATVQKQLLSFHQRYKRNWQLHKHNMRGINDSECVYLQEVACPQRAPCLLFLLTELDQSAVWSPTDIKEQHNSALMGRLTPLSLLLYLISLSNSAPWHGAPKWQRCQMARGEDTKLRQLLVKLEATNSQKVFLGAFSELSGVSV